MNRGGSWNNKAPRKDYLYIFAANHPGWRRHDLRSSAHLLRAQNCRPARRNKTLYTRNAKDFSGFGFEEVANPIDHASG